MKHITLFIIFLLHIVATQAVKITVNGITYDDFGSSVIHEGLYRNVSVVGVSNDVAGAVVIPALPAQVAGGLFYFRVTEIARNVFSNNTRITSITLPNTVTSVGNYAFNGCTNLTAATIHGGSIGDGAFYGCSSLSSVTFGENVTSIGSYIFHSCTNLTQIDAADGNTAYSSLGGVLYNKNRTALIVYPVGKPEQSFSVPEGVLSIVESAFQSSSLSSIILPQSLMAIGDWGVGDCRNLTSITIPRNVTSISTSAFNYCIELTGFEVMAENTAYSSSDGVLYDKSKTSIVRYPPNKANTSFVIPGTVTEISRYTFRDCLHLQSILLPENATTIGSGAFAWSKIKSVRLSKSINFINTYAFSGCADLTDITAFWNTPSEVSIAAGENASEDIFYEVDKSAVRLHVPPGTKAAYLASDVWKDFNIMDDATGIEYIILPAVGIYPNPATDYISLTGLQGNETLRVYNINGKLLLTCKATGETENIPVGHLSPGIYFVKVNNGQALKWLKK